MRADTKEQIKNRMIKKAASMWGVPANEIEMSFDPVVALLIAACASEMEKISNEIHQSQTRITEKLIQLMTPETVTGPKPAHGILKAFPTDETAAVKEEFMFLYRKTVANDKTSVKYKDVYFSPAQEANLIEAEIVHIACGNSIYGFDEIKQKELLFEHKNESVLPSSTMYLGISGGLKELLLKDISVYFELLDIDNKELFYHHLRNAKWSFEGQNIASIAGYFNSEDVNTTNMNRIFKTVSNKATITSQEVINNYRKHFITLKPSKKQPLIKSSFEELNGFINSNKIKVGADVRWVKVEFPRILTNNILKKCYISLNSFPVINRELHTSSYAMKEYINILPIKTEELFFDIQSISNTNGKEYHARSKDNSNLDKGTFVLRNDNVGKLDQRKAREYVIHLIELLKDESASFSFLNNDFLNSNLKGLNQLLAMLEKKVSESKQETTQTNYVFLNSYTPKENIVLEYWTTHGDIANNIKMGSMLSCYKGIGIASSGNYLITTTHGGKNDLSMKERLSSYRRSLLSRDRVVTKQDVISLCKEMYGEKISHVNVKKGFSSGIGVHEGIVQCIHIDLFPNTAMETKNEEWESLNNNLLLYLKNNSTNVFPYKIKIVI